MHVQLPSPAPARVPSPATGRATGPGVQATFDELGTALADVTFVVVDLETTGGSSATCGITEIGAVKVRGGEVLGEFQTLVNPAEPIPPFIQVLTGITDAMVADAPRIESALPAFLEFARDSVLVAHNAGFDITFLKAAAARGGHPWPGFAVVDTLHLARQLVRPDESPNHKLSSLALVFGAGTVPDHRALHDARATVDVLHGLIERVGNIGVHSLEELASYSSRVRPEQRRKRVLAEGLPQAPGVYLFQDGQGRVLYVGTSRDIRTRVRSYFTASEQRSRMAEMVRLAERVHPVVCQTPLEAAVRELRLIDEHQPRYNRRSKRARNQVWVKLTKERFPRLSIVSSVSDGSACIGPFRSRAHAQSAIDAVHEVLPLRQCTTRITGHGSACALADMGRCGAPCTGAQSREDYAVVAQGCSALFRDAATPAASALEERLRTLAAAERFEDAASVRDRFLHLVRATARVQRLAPLAATAQVIAARRHDSGGWELVCIRHGRFAGTLVTPRGADPMPLVRTLEQTAEVVTPTGTVRPAALIEESELVLRWLEAPGVRLVELDGEWSCPVDGAGAVRERLEPLVAGIERDTTRQFDSFSSVGRPVGVQLRDAEFLSGQGRPGRTGTLAG